ncbi:hypothetical protein A3F03_01420 [Candidatus Roizmanbacteria bacterium RIFCSPHIGHO2_12_FULL_41_11]|uniref:NfeD-like C-terminal domain-containing protein n=2 Tax=Candidatus Roizmaniibacteriota TaxID=1752723 RepID=A0A1F7J7D5_9BACT|nr:MAG: hypothetical protein A3F03_01420 [Candidatus Roizmanbacteria bacterium RIFCSPHIGHO2_12_FULL_41_11]OGK51517.1 MAG: hypothetical protein A2966_01535 [Candidatus Roizmanbacteria bacterium RIFCSPLOWO2_01_FULL_41_22]
MDLSDRNILLIIIGIVFITAEIIIGAATGFDLLLTGVILIISAIIGMILGSFTISLVLITILALLYIFIGRKFIKSKLTIATKSTNVDSLIGKKGMVVKGIQPHHPGQVKVEGELWRAESEKNIIEGSEVKIESVSGVTLKVY